MNYSHANYPLTQNYYLLKIILKYNFENNTKKLRNKLRKIVCGDLFPQKT